MNSIVVQVVRVEAELGAGIVHFAQEPAGEMPALKWLIKDVPTWQAYLPGQRYSISLTLLPDAAPSDPSSNSVSSPSSASPTPNPAPDSSAMPAEPTANS